MAAGIELLPEGTEEESKKSVYKRSVNVIAIVALLIVAAVLLGLFGYQMFLSASARSIETKTKDAEQQIVSQSGKEATHRLLVDKLETTSNFLSSQLVHSEGFKEILSILNKSGAKLTNSEFGSDGVFRIVGKSKNSEVLGKLIGGLINEARVDTFDQVELVDLSKEDSEEDKAEPYVFAIDMKFLKKGLMSATASAQSQP
jgi:hypothetical protein